MFLFDGCRVHSGTATARHGCAGVELRAAARAEHRAQCGAHARDRAHNHSCGSPLSCSSCAQTEARSDSEERESAVRRWRALWRINSPPIWTRNWCEARALIRATFLPPHFSHMMHAHAARSQARLFPATRTIPMSIRRRLLAVCEPPHSRAMRHVCRPLPQRDPAAA